jgi:hypothetical protein
MVESNAEDYIAAADAMALEDRAKLTQLQKDIMEAS